MNTTEENVQVRSPVPRVQGTAVLRDAQGNIKAYLTFDSQPEADENGSNTDDSGT